MKSIFLAMLAVVFLLAACSDTSIIYEEDAGSDEPYKIKIHEVKVVSETESSLTIDFTYTYEHEVPAHEIKVFVLPDHAYWSMSDVKIKKGKHSARAIIGLSSSNMKKDRVSESTTTLLRFRFDRYQPQKYLGNVWGLDVAYYKQWYKGV